MSSKCNNHIVRIRVRDADGRAWIARVTEEQFRRLKQRCGKSASVQVAINARGAVTAILSNGECRTLEQVLQRFRLNFDSRAFQLFVPQEWEELREQLMADDGSARLLLHGAEATGKDTFFRFFVDNLIQRYGADRVAVLTIPAEENDRLVGHLETKVTDFSNAVRMAKRAAMTVVCYFPEIESLFASGDYTGSWEHHYKAYLRDMLDGTQTLDADYVIASTNHLAIMGAPLLSRFQLHRLRMSLELAQGILSAHWPEELRNGFSSEHTMQKLARETIAEATLASRKKVTLQASDLTAFNGRFLTHLASDLKRRMKIRRRKESQFNPDQAFVDEVLHEHLEALLAPAAEAAGTRSITEFTVREFDPHDLPVTIAPKLDWCQRSKYLVS